MAKRKTDKAVETNAKTKKPKSNITSFFAPVVSLPKATGSAKPPDVNLDPEQSKVWQMIIEEEKNVFFTGAAGTGKSLLLRAIIKSLRRRYTKEMVAVTASTGMAASNIGGSTIHSWGAVPPNCNDLDRTIRRIRKGTPALERWLKVRVLVIDEVSMVDGPLFQRLHDIAVALRPKTTRPFGGIQVVVTGDFFQLPPVTERNKEPIFAFESAAWVATLEHTLQLTRVFRQKNPEFIAALNSLRLAAPTPEAIKLFRSLSRPLPPSSIRPTELFPLRSLVAESNDARLASLKSPQFSFDAEDSGPQVKLLDNLLAEKRLSLKAGAQVMLIKNVDEILVNGLVGSVIGFYNPDELAVGTPLSSSTSSVASSSSSVASSSKVTTKAVNNRILRYVQLSEDGRTPTVIPVAKKDQKGKNAVQEEQYPLVLFEYPLRDEEGYGSEAVLFEPEEFKVDDAEGKTLARRVQLPLVLAWAISIHKSQGQTIHRVKVNVDRVFEKGQTYVALSRASSMDGLQVIGFNANKVTAHRKVVEWSKTLA